MLSYSTAENLKLRRYVGRTKILTIRRILEGVRAKKKLEATILFVDFAKAFDFTHRGDME